MDGQETDSERRFMSVWVAWGILTLAVLLVLPLFGWIAHRQHGDAGLMSVVLAAGICWLSTSLALYMATRIKSGPGAMAGLLLGIMFRMGVPLAAGLLLTGAVPRLAEGRFLGQILSFYLVTLAVETVLLVKLFSASAGKLGIL